MTRPVAYEKIGPVGLWCGDLDRFARAELDEAISLFDESSLGTLWFSESDGREAFTHAQVMLSASRRLIIATGIANIWARDPMATNAASRLLGQWYANRFILGLGVSHQPFVIRERGHEYTKPVAAMRAYLTAMDAARFAAAGHADPRSPRIIAALGPKMLEVARDLADGALTYLVTPEHTAQAREVLGPNRLLAVELSCVLSGDRDDWQRAAHSHLELYTGLQNYRESWKRQGFSDEDFVRGGSTKLQVALVHFGLDATLKAIDKHLRAGADHVCVQVLGSVDGPIDAAARLRDWWSLAQAHTANG